MFLFKSDWDLTGSVNLTLPSDAICLYIREEKKRGGAGMNREPLIGIGISAVIIILVGICLFHRLSEREQLLQRFSEFEMQCQEKKAQGYNISEAEELARKAKQAFDKKNYAEASNLLDEAFEILRRIPTIPDEVKVKARERLSCIRVVISYTTITDGKLFNRSYDDIVNILKEVKTDFIFNAFHCWYTCPEHCEDIAKAPEGCIGNKNVQELILKCQEHGYSYAEFQNAVTKIKAEIPDVIIGVALPIEFLNKCSRNSLTGIYFLKDKTWEMALDPSKWGITDANGRLITRERFQCNWAKRHEWTETCEGYDPKEQMPFYFPDITNSAFQELYLSHAKRLIDAGADAIWIDMLYKPAKLLARLSEDPRHQSVKESFEAASRIVDEIHMYGISKGKWVYVGTWGQIEDTPFPPADLDFVTLTIPPDEILSMRLDESAWDEKLNAVRKHHPGARIFIFFDYGYPNSPAEVFSQRLTQEEQREFLRMADEFFAKKNVTLIYPVHGPFMGENIEVLSFGKFRAYDSLAPEFKTYETIKELARTREGEK